MKKYIALILICILSLCVLGGCDTLGNASSDATDVQIPTESVADEDVTAISTQAQSEAVTTEANVSVTDDLQAESEKTQGNTLVETEDFAVVITDCVTDEETGFTMNAYLENKTDATLEFKVTASAINSKDMHPDFACDVKAGGSITAPMVWSADKLSQRRVTDVKEVKIELQVISYSDDVKLLSSEIYTINP